MVYGTGTYAEETSGMSLSRSLQVTAAAFAFVSVGHTIKAQEFMNDPQFKRLPRFVSMYSRAGWYQGSVFFLIAAILNYRWAKSPALLLEPIDKAVAALMTTIALGTAAWYGKEGDRTTSGLLTIVGALQSYAAFLDTGRKLL